MCDRQYRKSSVVVEEYYTAQCISTRRVAVVNDFSVAATWLVGIRVDRIVVYTMIWCIHLDNAYTAICLNRYCSDVAFEFTYVCRTYTHSISTMLVKNTPSRFQGNISGYSLSHVLFYYIYYIIFAHIVHRSTRLIIHTCLYN